MNAANNLENVEVAKAHQPVVVEPTKESFEAAVHDPEFEIPTAEDLATLRRVSGKIPWSAYTIAFVELCERFSYYGTTAVCKLLATVIVFSLTGAQSSTSFSSLCQKVATPVQGSPVNRVLWTWASVPPPV